MNQGSVFEIIQLSIVSWLNTAIKWKLNDNSNKTVIFIAAQDVCRICFFYSILYPFFINNQLPYWTLSHQFKITNNFYYRLTLQDISNDVEEFT